MLDLFYGLAFSGLDLNFSCLYRFSGEGWRSYVVNLREMLSLYLGQYFIVFLDVSSGRNSARPTSSGRHEIYMPPFPDFLLANWPCFKLTNIGILPDLHSGYPHRIPPTQDYRACSCSDGVRYRCCYGVLASIKQGIRKWAMRIHIINHFSPSINSFLT